MGNSIAKRQLHKISFMYNVNTGMVPSYRHDIIPPLVSEISDNPLRNKIIDIYLYLLIELVFHRNLVFHQPLGYGIHLMITLKIYQPCPLLKSI